MTPAQRIRLTPMLLLGVTLWTAACGGGGGTPPQATSSAVTGTAADDDADGIPDAWETGGVDYTDPVDGTTHHLDLQTRGASPKHKDIFIWTSWMSGADHTHMPEANAQATLVNAFKSAPVTNPDGTLGINVHILFASRSLPEQQILGSGGGGNYDWSAFDALKKAQFPSQFGDAFLYCVFAHSIDAQQHSGIAKTIPGRDFIVSLGGFTGDVGTSQEKAGTMMHELGHTLGLHHGGQDDKNFKPNYLSVMNYYFQLNGLYIGGRQGNYDYSTFSVPALEPTLSETGGLTNDSRLSRYGTLFICCAQCATHRGEKRAAPSIVGGPVDWNCDGATSSTSVSTDINSDGAVASLVGLDDWQNIVLKPKASTAGVAPESVVGVRPDDEITPSQADSIPLFPVSDVHAEVRGDGVSVAWSAIPLDRVVAYRIYRAAEGQAPQIIGVADNSSNPAYADQTAPRGRFNYFVSAVFAPHSAALASSPVPSGPATTPPPPPPPPPPAADNFRLVFPSSILVMNRTAEVASIRDAAPKSASRVETLGITPGTADVQRSFPTTLFETAPSRAAHVSVLR
jgi:hypothetical protein